MTSKSVATALALLVFSSTLTSLAATSTPIAPDAAAASETRTRVLFWNRTAIDASGLDHTHPGPDDDWTFGQQLGPGRAARAMAIVHIAIFEAVNAVAGGYKSYAGVPAAKSNTSIDAA